MMTPFGTYTTPRRLSGLPAVLASAESAGTIPSRSGSASVAPSPRNTARRGIALFEMIGILLPSYVFTWCTHGSSRLRPGRLRLSVAHGARLERRALDNLQNEC